MRLGINGRFYFARPTGVQRSAREISARLAARCSARVFLPRRSAVAGASPEAVSVRGWLRGHAWEQLELPRMAAGCDVVLHPANTCPLAGSRNVVFVHDVLPLTNPAWFGRRFALWYRTVIRRAVRGAAAVLVPTRWTAEQITEQVGVEPERITVVGQGVEPFDQPASEEIVAAVRSKWDLPERFLLAVDGGDPRKNLVFVLRVLASMGVRSLPLVVAGRRPSRIHRVAPERREGSDGGREMAGRVVELGWVSDEELQGLYTAASLLLFPSLGEGFGRPPLEAAGCGTASVVAPYGPASEVLRDGAEILPLDELTWARAVAELMEDEERALALAARGAGVAADHRWDDTVSRVLGACEAVAARRFVSGGAR